MKYIKTNRSPFGGHQVWFRNDEAITYEVLKTLRKDTGCATIYTSLSAPRQRFYFYFADVTDKQLATEKAMSLACAWFDQAGR